MFHSLGFQRSRCAAIAVVLGGLVVGGLRPCPVSAAEPLKESTSLKFVPAEVAFYSASFRMKEQYDAFVQSKAFAKLKALPSVQMGMMLIEQQLLANPEFGKPENQELLKLLGEMFSQEVFVVGDNRFAELSEVFIKVSNANQMAQFEAMLEGRIEEQSNSRSGILELDRNRDRLRVPSLIVGFKLNDAKAAKTQIARLQTVLEQAIAGEPKLVGRLKKTTVAGNEYLAMQLDGSLVPWEDVPIAQFENEPGEFSKLIDHLKKMTMTITVGLRGEYLLVAVGEKADHLKTLDGKTLLYDRAELAPLRKAADKPLVGVSYTSEELAKTSDSQQAQVDQMIAVVEKAYAKAPVDAKVKAEFQADVQKFKKYLSDQTQHAGASISYSFRTKSGFESFAYSWSVNELADASQKLSLLQHMGGNPIAFSTMRSKAEAGDYQKFAEFLKRGFYYAEKVALVELGKAEREQYEQVRGKLLPLFVRLHKTNSENLVPALKDGQSGFVLDAKISSKQWFQDMPPSVTPLPMLELGLVFGVSDAEKLKTACKDYREVIQKMLDVAAETAPDQIPRLKIPDAIETKTPAGTTYHYPQLAEHGVDEQIAPTAGLSKSVAVLSTSRKLAERLLADKPPELPEGLLPDRDRPLSQASYFNWPALVDVAKPWIDYGFGIYDGIVQAQPPDGNPVRQQVHTVLDVLKCYRGSSSATYLEGKATVTHSHSIWKDLEE
jgi:hypothetical protein